jgi:hypothetical protein
VLLQYGGGKRPPVMRVELWRCRPRGWEYAGLPGDEPDEEWGWDVTGDDYWEGTEAAPPPPPPPPPKAAPAVDAYDRPLERHEWEWLLRGQRGRAARKRMREEQREEHAMARKKKRREAEVAKQAEPRGRAGRPSHTTFLHNNPRVVHEFCAKVAALPASPTGHIYLDDYLGCAHISTTDARALPGVAWASEGGGPRQPRVPPPRRRVAQAGIVGVGPRRAGRAAHGAGFSAVVQALAWLHRSTTLNSAWSVGQRETVPTQQPTAGGATLGW